MKPFSTVLLPKRPTGVTIVTLLILLLSVLAVIGGLVLLISPDFVKDHLDEYPAVGFETLAAFGGLVLLIMALLYGLVAYGLWRLKNWARIVTLIFFVIDAIGQAIEAIAALAQFNLLSCFENVLMLGIEGLIIWYLLQPHIKQGFTRKPLSTAAARQ